LRCPLKPPTLKFIHFTIFPPIFPLFLSLPAFPSLLFSISMGKYMKKSKIAGDVAAVIMESPSHTTAVGVRTRAKTLALQKSPPIHPDSSSFLQLRSRRLRKVPPPLPPRKESGSAGNSRLRDCSVEKLGNFCAEEENENGDDFDVEGSFGENFAEIDGRDRYNYSSIASIFVCFYSIYSIFVCYFFFPFVLLLYSISKKLNFYDVIYVLN